MFTIILLSLGILQLFANRLQYEVTGSVPKMASKNISKVIKNFWWLVEYKMFENTWPSFDIKQNGMASEIKGKKRVLYLLNIPFKLSIFCKKLKKRNCSTCRSKSHYFILRQFVTYLIVRMGLKIFLNNDKSFLHIL